MLGWSSAGLCLPEDHFERAHAQQCRLGCHQLLETSCWSAGSAQVCPLLCRGKLLRPESDALSQHELQNQMS